MPRGSGRDSNELSCIIFTSIHQQLPKLYLVSVRIDDLMKWEMMGRAFSDGFVEGAYINAAGFACICSRTKPSLHSLLLS